MVRKDHEARRTCPATYPGERNSTSTSSSAIQSYIERAARPYLECLKAVAKSITATDSAPLSPRASGLLVRSTLATRRPLLAQLRRAAAAIEKLCVLIEAMAYPPPDDMLNLIFEQLENRVAVLQLLAAAVVALEDTDRGLSTEDRECCAKLFSCAASLVHLTLLSEDTQPNAAPAVASLLVRMKLLPSLSSLLVTARDPERRQAMGRLQDWYQETVMLADSVTQFVQLAWNIVYGTQSTFTMLSNAQDAPLSAPQQRRLMLAVKLLEAMAQNHYVEQIVRTTLFIILSPISSDLPISRCIADAITVLNRLHDTAREFMLLNQKLMVQNEAAIRITAALRTLLFGPNSNYFAVASTVTQLAALDGGTMYGMDPAHAAKLRLLNPADGPPQSQEQESDCVAALRWSSSFWALCLDHDLPLRLCIHGSECNLSRAVLRELGLRLMRVARRWRGGEEELKEEQRDTPLDRGLDLDPQWSVLAVNAMHIIFYCSLHDLVWLTEPTSPWDDGNIETDIVVASEVWSELVPTAHRVLVLLDDCEIAGLTRVAVPTWPDGDLPPAPPPNLAAALTAAFVPFLERSLRLMADRQRAAPHDLLLAFSNWSRFGRMLAYGEWQQLEALLVTGAKLIRRLGAADAEAAAGDGGDEGTMDRSIQGLQDTKGIQELVLRDMLSWMKHYAAVLCGHVSAHASGGAAGTAAALPDCDVLCTPRKDLEAMSLEPTCGRCFSAAVGRSGGAAYGGSSEVSDSGLSDTNGPCSSGISGSGLSSGGTSGGSGPSDPSRDTKRQQPDDGGPSVNACSGSGPTGPGDDGDRGSCSNTFDGSGLEQDRADGPSTSPCEEFGGSGSGGSSDVLQWAKGPAHQLLGLIVRAAQLWLPAVNSALTQLTARVGPKMREDVLQGWNGVAMWVAPMAVAHALAAGRLALPDWWLLYGSAVGEQQLRTAGAFWRHLLLEELGVVELVGRMLKLMMQEGDGVVDCSLHVCSSVCIALSCLVSEFPAEVAGLRDCLQQLCSLQRGGRPDADTQRMCRLMERLNVLGGMSPAEAATAHMPLGHLLPDDFVSRPHGPRCVGELLLLGSLLESVGTPAAGRLPTCGNPACTNLAGDSEAALPLPKKCGKCEQVSYCSGACQWAHWTSGHNEQCAGLQQRPQQAAG